jgi:PAS domain S-box-containing protein
VGVGQEYIQKNLASIMRDGLIYIVIALLLGTFFAIVIGNKLSSGLYKLIAAADRIRTGDPEMRVKTFNSFELSKLGTAFNQMLDEVSANERLLGMVIENMPVGVWLFDEKGRIISCNSAGKALWGGVLYVGMDEYNIYKVWNTQTGKPLQPGEWGAARAILKGETVLNDEVEIESFDRKRKIILTSAIPLKDNGGEIIGAIAIHVDITESKKTIEQLALSESVLRNAFEYSAIGMSLVMPTGKWVRVNKSLCKMLGYSEQELLSLSFQEITWPEDLEPDLALVKRTLDGEINSYQMEKRYFHKDRSVIWARLSVSLVRDNHDKPLFFISQIEDISERKRSEAIILHEKNLSDTVIDGMPGIFYLSDKEGRMLRWNTNLETITGFSAAEVSTMNAIDFVNVEKKEYAFAKRKEALSQGRSFGEFDLRTRSGQKLIYYVSVMPIFYNNQQNLLGIGVDFTEKKESEQAILQLNRLYQFTNAINDMMLHAENKQVLFSEACKIAIEHGRFSMAWIGNFSLESSTLEIFARAGNNEGYLELLQHRLGKEEFEKNVAGQAIAIRKPYYCNDIANDGFDLPLKAEALKRGYRSLISLPVIVGAKLEAVFTLYMPQAFFFTGEEVKLLQEVTNNIAYAVEKLELKESQTVSQGLLKESEEKFRKLVEEALVGVFILKDGQFVYVNPQFEKISGYSATALMNEVSFDDLIHENYLGKTWKHYLGAIVNERHPGHFFPKMVRSNGALLQIEIIASAITYKGGPAVIGTIVDITAQAEEEKRLNKAVTDAQENQRQQISMELHDNVKQMLAASLLNIDFLKMIVKDEASTLPIISNVKNYMREAIEELRRIAHQLAPTVDETISLEEKFRTVVDSMNVSGNITVNYHFEKFEEAIRKDVQLAMYRILQEQFSNILKYANASLVDINVQRQNGDIYMAIQDDGIGFDTSTKKHGIGLENIKRRVQVFNGNFQISSSPGKGCRLDVEIPVNGIE